MEGPTKKVKRLQDLCFLASPVFANASINDLLGLSRDVVHIVTERGKLIMQHVQQKLRQETGCNDICISFSLKDDFVLACHVNLAHDDKFVAATFLENEFVCEISNCEIHVKYGAEELMPGLRDFPMEQVKKLIEYGIYKKAQDITSELMDKTAEELNAL